MSADIRSFSLSLFVAVTLAVIIGCGGGGGSSSNTTGLTNSSTNGNTNNSTNGNTNGSTNSTSSTASTGEGTPQVIHFDDLPAVSSQSGTNVTANAQLSTQYLNSLGVKFTSGANYVAVVQLPSGNAPSGSNAIAGIASNGTVSYSQANAIDITFWDPTDPTKKGVVKYVAVTADNDGNPAQNLTVQAYDVNGTLLHTESPPDEGGETVYIQADQPVIHRIRILGSQTEQNGIAIDDVTFKPVVRG